MTWKLAKAFAQLT